jgi:hypothetical protein
LVNLRFKGDESELLSFYQEAKQRLKCMVENGLDKTLRASWYRATKRSLKRNSDLQSEAFQFLIPCFLSFSRSRHDIGTIDVLLDARKYKVKHSDAVDKLLIAKLQVWITQQRLFKISTSAKTHASTLEHAIATAELYFYSNKPLKGLRHLRDYYESLAQKAKRPQRYLRELCINKARETDQKDMEIYFLKEEFLNGMAVLPDKLTRFTSLLEPETREREVNDLVNKLKVGNDPFSFEKISALLLYVNRYDDLIKELKKHNDKFLLLHNVVLMKLPDYDSELLILYTKQLMEAFSNRRIFHRPEELFAFSKEYVDQLPLAARRKVVQAVLDKLGGQSGIYRYVKSLFEVEVG